MTKAKSAPMIFCCGNCGAFGSPELFSTDVEARVVSSLLAKMPGDLGTAVLMYLRIWAPSKHALTWRRARIVLEELLPMVEAQQIRRNGRDWPAPAAAWIDAIQAMTNNLNLKKPVKSNGYLLSIIAGEADNAEAAAERTVEASRKAGKPAVTLDEQIERTRKFEKDCRTALALVESEATITRNRFKETYSADQARSLLVGRGYQEDVIGNALAAHFGDALQ